MMSPATSATILGFRIFVSVRFLWEDVRGDTWMCMFVVT
jgi:hypothetical protein